MIFNLTMFHSSLKEERFHFISVCIDNPGHNTCIYRPYYTELNQHLLYTRFIANQGDKSITRFHFISVYIDNPGHNTCIYRPYYTELNQHLSYTRFIANQGDKSITTDNLIHEL